jgi:hypothetical protein
MFKICFTMLCWFNDVSCKYFTYWAKFYYDFLVSILLRFIMFYDVLLVY